MTEAAVLKKDALYDKLRHDIFAGIYGGGSRLPNEADFCRELGVGKVTLRSALARLEEESLIVRVPGKGTFVAARECGNRLLVVTIRGNATVLPHNYIIPGVENAAAEFGFVTEQCFIEDIRKLTEEQALEILRAKNLCGVLLISSSCRNDDPEIIYLHKLGLPVVITHGLYSDRLCNFALIYTQLREAFASAIRLLAAKGHRRINIVGMRRDDVRDWSEGELADLYRHLRLEVSGKFIFYADNFSPDDIRHSMDEMLAMPEKPTAILAFSDFFAIEIIDYLQGKGIRVPQDVAVMGFCGYPGGTFLPVPLSTIDFQYTNIGRIAVELIANSQIWFKQPNVALPVIAAPYRTIERESTNVVRVENNFKHAQKMEAVSC